MVGELQDGKLKWRADSDSQLTKVQTHALSCLHCSPVHTYSVDIVVAVRRVC